MIPSLAGERRLALIRVEDEAPSLAVPAWLSRDLAWGRVLARGLGVRPFWVCARDENQELLGCLCVCLVSSWLFGRFLVGMPYLNYGGVVFGPGVDGASDAGREIELALISRACELADELNVQYLELRHEREVVHPKLTVKVESKVHMRLDLADSVDAQRAALKSSVRSQVKKGEKTHPFEIVWGGLELLPEYYDVFAVNMRDLGTPVFGQALFRSILEEFPDRAELCVVRLEGSAIAAAILLHGDGVTEVPSASSLRSANPTNVNMVMYWNLLARAVERGQKVFDFGRSTPESGTFRFKKQWGALPYPSVWQYYVRRGEVGGMRPESKKFSLAIRVWQKLPVWLTRWIGPGIVKAIP